MISRCAAAVAIANAVEESDGDLQIRLDWVGNWRVPARDATCRLALKGLERYRLIDAEPAGLERIDVDGVAYLAVHPAILDQRRFRRVLTPSTDGGDRPVVFPRKDLRRRTEMPGPGRFRRSFCPGSRMSAGPKGQGGYRLRHDQGNAITIRRVDDPGQ